MSSSENNIRPTTAQTYGYGFLATFITCLASLACIIVFYLVPKKNHDHVSKFLGSMAVGTLVGDAVLHLLPQALEMHVHHHDEEDSAETHHDISQKKVILRLTTVIIGIYAFYLLDMALNKIIDFVHKKYHKNQNEVCELQSPTDVETTAECGCPSPITEKATFKIWKDKKGFSWRMKRTIVCIKEINAYAWCLLVADAVHNLADGVALGAAFAQRLNLGFTTMLAVLFHELPQELGDYAVLVESGLTHWQALFLNFITGLTALIGFFVGAALSTTSDEFLGWILAFTAGIFLYVALTGILPRLCPNSGECNSTKCLMIYSGGVAIGIVFMFLLAYFEGNIQEMLSMNNTSTPQP